MKWPWSRRRTIIAGIALVVMALIALALRPSPVTVETAEASRMRLEVHVEEDGRTRAVDRYIVTAPVTGHLARIELREGTQVRQGTVLARIEAMPLDVTTESSLRAALTAAEARRSSTAAAREQAAAALDQARRELARRRSLAEQGALAAEHVEQYALATRLREEELHSAEQALRAATADVQAARTALPATQASSAPSAVAVRAPADGVLLRVPERSARVVSAGTPLVEVGDPKALEVVVDVLTTDAVRIRPGMPATLRNWGGDPLTATVRMVEPSAFTRISALGVEEQRVNVVLDLEHRPQELGDGYRVDAAILVWSGTDVLTVPSSALFRTPDGWATFAVEAGRARLRAVQLGERSGAHAQVLRGLEHGTTVILFPADQMHDGQRVRAQR
jgi:HlyD family secretion protein